MIGYEKRTGKRKMNSAKLNFFELEALKLSQSENQWSAVCSEIRAKRSGNYPTDWQETVLASGLLVEKRAEWSINELAAKEQTVRAERRPHGFWSVTEVLAKRPKASSIPVLYDSIRSILSAKLSEEQNSSSEQQL